MASLYKFSVVLACLVASICASSFTPARPPAIPLAVKSPYLSTWLQAGSDGGNGGYLAGQWPTFWNGAITGWTGIIRVDGKSHVWMGKPEGAPSVTQTDFKYTSTQSIFTQRVNNEVAIVVTFLSPVTPHDYVSASVISSYMHVSVHSLDGKKHNVQLYTDISGEWVSGDRGVEIEWDYGVSQTNVGPAAANTRRDSESEDDGAKRTRRHLAKHKRRAASQATRYASSTALSTSMSSVETESIESSTYESSTTQEASSAFTSGSTTSHEYATVSSASTSDAPRNTSAARLPVHVNAVANGIAYHRICRRVPAQFSEYNQQTEYGNWYYMTHSSGQLSHQSGQDTKVRTRFMNKGHLANTKDQRYRAISDDYPVFAYAVDLGKVGAQPVKSVFTINLNQRAVIQFQGAQGVHNVPALWTSYFSSDLATNTWFYRQYADNLATANTLDAKIVKDSRAAGGDNYATITSLALRQAFGALQFAGHGDNIKLFLKEISSDGNIQTVDVIYPFHPVVLYTNPALLRFMLEPLMVNQEAGHWPYKFSIHDLGSSYPNATGHADGRAEQQPLEECGDMIIMSLAYAQRANDNAWLNRHYKLLLQWSKYLIEEALVPASQLSTDDFAGSIANQTNLALKGIIGIEAMARIAKRTGHPKDATRLDKIAQTYINRWQVFATSKNGGKHTTLAYGKQNTYSLLYNLFADRLLNLDLVPKKIYDMQSAYYPKVALQYGVPLDSRHTYTKVDWEMFCAAVASASTKNMFINKIARWINNTPTSGPFTDLYDASSSNYASGITFQDRPVVGGEFALLAL